MPKLPADAGARRRKSAPRAAANEQEDTTIMTKTPTPHPLALAIAGLALAAAGGSAFGSGFQLNESSASGLGNAFAGGAAAAQDASTLWSNPAGMSRLGGRQLVGVIHLIRPSMKFNDEGSVAAASQPLGGNGGDAGGLNVVPNLYFAMPINPTLSAGVGVTAPWGLVTEYDNGWIGRFQAIKSSIKTYNVNPAVSWKAANNLALGLGLNIQRLEGEFTNQVNYSAGLLNAAALNGIAPGSATFNAIAAATPGLESSVQIKGSDNAFGWNIGLLWEPDAASRVGVHYRSRISYHLSGNATFANPALPALPPALAVVGLLANGVNAKLSNTSITSDVKMPDIFNLSYFRTLDSRWDVMADAQWTGWSAIQNLTFTLSDGSTLGSTPLNFQNTWKVALGASYHSGNEWTWRGGVAYSQSPVRDEFRTPRLPDSPRTWLAGGGQYKVSNAFKLDFGGAYLWIKKATIDINGNPPSTPANGLINGHYNSSTWILSAQGTWSF